jgi:hypothetical protein
MRICLLPLLSFLTVCAPGFVQAAGLFVTFNGADTVRLYDAQSGQVLNSTFASVQSPLGLTIGPDHNLYVGSDNLPVGGAGIVRFGISGTTGAPLGTFVDHVSDNELNNPQGLGFQGGNLFTADATAGSIFVYNNSGTHLNTLSAPGLFLSAPIGLTFDSGGTLYVADENQGNVLSYSGGSFAQVNSQSGVFIAARDVAVGGDGNLYVLNVASDGGIYKLSLSNGSAQKIVDYSTSFFQASDMVIGPDLQLYVSGQDFNSGDGQILKYGLDGSGGTVFADTGFGTSPSFMAFDVPEPSLMSLCGLAAVLSVIRRKGSLRCL